MSKNIAINRALDANTNLASVLSRYKAVDLTDFHYPQGEGWHLHYEAMQFAVECVRQLRPARVAEFGSGRSTEVLGKVLSEQGGEIISFDHLQEMARENAAKLVRSSPNGGSAVHYCRVAPHRYGLKVLMIYGGCGRLLSAGGEFQLALIDGPPWFIGREAVLYELFPRIAVGGWVIVDDANRPFEKKWMETWKEVYGDALDIRTYPEIGKGVALLIKLRSVSPQYQFESRDVLQSIVATARTLWRMARYGEGYVP